MTPTTRSDDQANEIISAMRQISDSAELRAEAATSPDSVLNRLRLSGVARHAVALGIAALAVAPMAARSGTVTPNGFWT
jgi:hypothetical protein